MEGRSRELDASLRRMGESPSDRPFDPERGRRLEEEAAAVRRAATGAAAVVGCAAVLVAIVTILALPFALAAAGWRGWRRRGRIRKLERALGDPEADPHGFFDRAVELSALEFGVPTAAVVACLMDESAPPGRRPGPAGSALQAAATTVIASRLGGFDLGPAELAVETVGGDVVLSHRLRVARGDRVLRPLRIELARFERRARPEVAVRTDELGGFEVTVGGAPALEFLPAQETAARAAAARIASALEGGAESKG
jgi:hypothetical protein